MMRRVIQTKFDGWLLLGLTTGGQNLHIGKGKYSKKNAIDQYLS